MGKVGNRTNQYIEDYVVFDFETTGISVVRDEIIEISALRVRNHQKVETFSRLVNPGQPIPYGATKVNGITDEMVKEHPRLDEVLPDFLGFIGGDVLVGHNIRSFDLKFLYRDAQMLLQQEIDNDFIDTLYMARTCLPQLAHHRLTDLAVYFKVSTQGAHRALNDCIMNQICYEQMGKLIKAADIPICEKCGAAMVQRSGKFGSFYGCLNFPVCRHTKKIREVL